MRVIEHSDRHTRHQRRWRTLMVASLVVAIDQLTKTIATHLAPRAGVHVVGPLGFWLVGDPASSMSYVPRTSIWLAVGLFVLGASVATYSVFTPSRLARIGSAAALGGMVGNELDAVFRGGWVVDFIWWQNWCIFNLADASIAFGVLAMAGGTLWRALVTPRRGASRRLLATNS